MCGVTERRSRQSIFARYQIIRSIFEHSVIQLLQHVTPASSSCAGPRLKVAYIMSRFPKISETFILYEMIALKDLGADVEVFPLLREQQKVVHGEAKAIVEGAHFHPFLSLPIVRAHLHFLRRRPRAYLKVFLEVLKGTLGSINFFVGALGVLPKSVLFAKEMMGLGITHVHAHFATHPAVAALIIHRLTGISFSFTAHGSDLHVERRMLTKKVESASFVVAVSSYNKELIIRECGEKFRDKIHVVHCGIDPEVFNPRLEYGDIDPFQILCVASFEEVKGHRHLIEACKVVRKRGIRFMCHLVGEGHLRREIEHLVKQAGLQDQVRFHGALTRDEVANLLTRVDVKVLASVPTKNGKREGIPVALMEAMASGLPVVASRLSGIPELVKNDQSGILIEPGDSLSIADALQRLQRDLPLRRKLGFAGREHVLREFNLLRCAGKLAALFKNSNGKCRELFKRSRSSTVVEQES